SPAAGTNSCAEPFSADLRFLPTCFLHETKRPAAEADSAPPAYQRKPEHRERDGDGQRPAHEKERRSGERGDAATLADNGCKLARICPHKETPSNQEKQKDRTTGKKIDHCQTPLSRAAREDGLRRRSSSCR